MFSLNALEIRLTEVAIGTSGIKAIRALIQEQFNFATEQPGMFAASIYPPGNDNEILEAIERVNHPMHKMLEQAKIGEPQRTHWSRLALSTIYGFTMLRRDRQLTLPVAPDQSMEYLVSVLVNEIEKELIHID